MARRYHWHSVSVRDFVSSRTKESWGSRKESFSIWWMRKAATARHTLLAIASEPPEKTLQEVRHLHLPGHHDVRREDVDLKRLGAVLAVAYERDLKSFADLLLVQI